MNLTVAWDYPVETILLQHLPWRTSVDIAEAVSRFAARRALRLATGEYQLDAAGYRITVRVERAAGMVLVLHLHRVR